MFELHSFTIENFRSFCSPQTIPFDSGSNHFITAIFGPNAGGKSNVARALAAFVACIRNSTNANWNLPYEPFLLKEGMDAHPTTLSLDFSHEGRRYSYSFSFLFDKITRETLYEESDGTGRMNVIFDRDTEGLNPYAKQHRFGSRLLKKTREDSLLITKGREDNNTYSNIVFDLLDHITIVSPAADSPSPIFVDLLKEDPSLREKTLKLLRDCDFSIRDIRFVETPIPEDFFDQFPIQLAPEMKRALIEGGTTAFKTVHALRDEEKSIIGYRELDFWGQESMGTQKFFEVAVPIIDALENGKTIFIDEFGSFIHPTLSRAILSLFEKNEESRARMLLTTHDTTLLNDLDRSEIIFLEKNLAEESIVTELASMSVRSNEAFEKRYLAGVYGAVPIIEQ